MILMPTSLESMRSPPSMLPRVCVGPSISPQYLGRVNISWDPLPCHLQNGADIFDYIIQYTPLSTGMTTRITSSNGGVGCSQEVGGPYSCLVAESLLHSHNSYSIRIAALNNNGDGSFSDPINVSLPVSSRWYFKGYCQCGNIYSLTGTTCTHSADANADGGTSTISESILSDVSEDTVHGISGLMHLDSSISVNITATHCCINYWPCSAS